MTRMRNEEKEKRDELESTQEKHKEFLIKPNFSYGNELSSEDNKILLRDITNFYKVLAKDATSTDLPCTLR